MQDTTPIDDSTKRKYFSFDERKKREKLRKEGIGVCECARILQRSSHTSLLEELKRIPQHTNALGRKVLYTAEYAQRDFLQKQQNKGNIRKLDKDPRLREAIVEGIPNIRNNRDMPEMSGKKSIRYDNISGLPHDGILKTIWDDLIHEDPCYTRMRYGRSTPILRSSDISHFGINATIASLVYQS